MEVLCDNLESSFEEFSQHIATARFCAIDLEMTGIMHPDTRMDLNDAPEERYVKMCKIASMYNIIQFGICLAHDDPEVPGGFIMRPFNCYMFPRHVGHHLSCPLITMEPSSVEFNSKHGVDWNKWVKQGVGYVDQRVEAKLVKACETEDARDLSYVNNRKYTVVGPGQAVYESHLAHAKAWVRGAVRALGREAINAEDPFLKQYAAQVPVPGGASVFALELTLPPASQFVCEALVTTLMKERDALVDAAATAAFEELNLSHARHEAEAGAATPQADTAHTPPRINKRQRLAAIPRVVLYCEPTPVGGASALHIARLQLMHGHDFDAMVAAKRRARRRELFSQVGMRHFLTSIVEHRVPLVGHNCAYDLMFLFHTLEAPLPFRFSDFCAEVHRRFPLLFDTKFVHTDASYRALPGALSCRETGLGALHEEYIAARQAWLDGASTPFRGATAVRVAEGYDRYIASGPAHEAGYDALCTASVFASMLRVLEHHAAATHGVPLTLADPATVASLPPIAPNATTRPCVPAPGLLSLLLPLAGCVTTAKLRSHLSLLPERFTALAQYAAHTRTVILHAPPHHQGEPEGAPGLRPDWCKFLQAGELSKQALQRVVSAIVAQPVELSGFAHLYRLSHLAPAQPHPRAGSLAESFGLDHAGTVQTPSAYLAVLPTAQAERLVAHNAQSPLRAVYAATGSAAELAERYISARDASRLPAPLTGLCAEVYAGGDRPGYTSIEQLLSLADQVVSAATKGADSLAPVMTGDSVAALEAAMQPPPAALRKDFAACFALLAERAHETDFVLAQTPPNVAAAAVDGNKNGNKKVSKEKTEAAPDATALAPSLPTTVAQALPPRALSCIAGALCAAWEQTIAEYTRCPERQRRALVQLACIAAPIDAPVAPRAPRGAPAAVCEAVDNANCAKDSLGELIAAYVRHALHATLPVVRARVKSITESSADKEDVVSTLGPLHLLMLLIAAVGPHATTLTACAGGRALCLLANVVADLVEELGVYMTARTPPPVPAAAAEGKKAKAPVYPAPRTDPVLRTIALRGALAAARACGLVELEPRLLALCNRFAESPAADGDAQENVASLTTSTETASAMTAQQPVSTAADSGAAS